MSEAAPTGARLRVAAVILFIGVPLAAAAVAALATVRAFETGAVAAAQRAEVDLLRARLARNGAAPPPATDSLYIEGASPSLAAATLQQRLVTLAGGRNARVFEARTLTDETTPDRIRVAIAFEAANDDLLAILLAVETGLPLMTVTDLVAAPAAAPANGGAPLRVELTVEAYRAPEDTPS